jgi:Undecaprenyl-phosphate glucose phosphotransferase
MGSAFVLHLSDHYFSRLWTVWWFIVGLLALWLWRAGMGWLILHMSAAGRLALKVALIGPSAYCRPVITKLLQTDPQVQVLGIFDDSRLHSSPASPDHDVSGSINDLLEIVRARQVDRIIVAVPWSAGERVPQIIAYFEGVAIDIDLALEGILSRNTGSLQYRPQDDIPTLSIANPPLATWRLAIKVLEDKILAALILLLLAPLMVAIAVAIRVSSPGSSIFRQIRLGFNNDTIEVYKFRTMYDHLRDDQAIQPVKHGDARVTPLGKFLRKFSLDELPQLFNVLRGDMSLVGPRPHVLAAKVSDCLFSEVVASYAARHRVRPGMTGWAQVNGWRGEADTIEKVEHRVRCDLYYINNWSLLLDFKILALTIPAVVWPRNAY